jgi:hypothetical protein
MTQEIQFCKDCKHINKWPFFFDLEVATCKVHKETKDKDNLVGARSRNSFCNIVRKYDYHNSPTCPKFEKRKSIWDKLNYHLLGRIS